MIDPINMTEYGASEDRLEEIILFTVIAAGHNAIASAKALEKLIQYLREVLYPLSQAKGETYTTSPFGLIRLFDKLQNSIHAASLETCMKHCGIGCYTNRAKSFRQLSYSKLNLKTCATDDLEKIHGIGFKSSRFFILHTRRNAHVAALDVHVLHWLRDQGYENVPKSTPSGKRYLELERIFLNECKKRKMNPAVMDLRIWNKYSKNKVVV